MINLFYITNNLIEAQIVDDLDIDWIFIDLETIGKKDRQKASMGGLMGEAGLARRKRIGCA